MSSGVTQGNTVLVSNLYTSVTTVGNVGTGEDTLQTYTMPSGMLAVDGDRIEFRACGSVVSNTNAKRLRVVFGSTTIFDTGASGIPISTALDWVLTGQVIRKGAALQVCNVSLDASTATLTPIVPYADTTLPTETLSGALILKVTGEAVSNDDIVCNSFTVSGVGPVVRGAGPSFPLYPTTGLQWFRTDLGLNCYYDGTRWLTVNEYEVSLGVEQVLFPLAATANFGWVPVGTDYDIYLTRWNTVTLVSSPNTGVNKWTVELYYGVSPNTYTLISSFSTGTTPDATSTHVDHSVNINAALDSAALSLRCQVVKVASPGTIFPISSIRFRKIIT